MNTNRQTAVIEGNKHPHQKERTIKPTVSNVIRWAGFSAMVAGIM